ncbi:MAG TPA: thymidylate synthase, partial [Ktedonobacterales bacterium]|nr:thymidylate synthase [Ktedonobacterales bacterium]
WRGGYGPRLRNWSGVDQVREVVHTLRRSPESRQAVIVLFDPARDNTASRDIPCNNWLRALVRQGRVDVSVALRSNDIMWGFSGIDTFAWSVLQELIAHATSTDLGTTSYFIDSLHLYERHYARAERILADRRCHTLYDFGFTSPQFSTSLEALDDNLTAWFILEDRIRRAEEIPASEWSTVSDDLLGTFLRLVAIYNRFLDGAERSELGEQVAALPESDLKVGAIEYLTRRLNDRACVPLTPHEQAFFAYFWNGAQVNKTFTFEQVFTVLSVLHDKKTRGLRRQLEEARRALGHLRQHHAKVRSSGGGTRTECHGARGRVDP